MREHPAWGRKVDVVALLLEDRFESNFLAFDLFDTDNSVLRHDVTDSIFIVGFPFGKSVHDLIPIWSKGSIATPIGLGFNGKPAFLADIRTREGQYRSSISVLL